MRDVGEGPFEPEMEHEQRRRKALALERLDLSRAARVALDQAVAVRRRRRWWRPRRPRRASRSGPDRLGDAACDLDRDRPDRRGGASPPSRSNKRDHAGDQPVGAALGEPHAAVALELVDQRVDRASGHRIAADEQGVEAQCLAQLFVRAQTLRRSNRPSATPGSLASAGAALSMSTKSRNALVPSFT